MQAFVLRAYNKPNDTSPVFLSDHVTDFYFEPNLI